MPTPVTPKADLVEIFSSVQGEGVLVGVRQIFLRFPDCNLACRYCDTDFARSPECLIENRPGCGEMINVPNPVTLETVKKTLAGWCEQQPGAHHSLSVTGGEPLLHHEVLKRWLPELRKILPIYLETNGTLPEPLEELLFSVDWVAMDIKLHSQTGERTDWEVHRRFLEIARRTGCFVKLVVGEETPDLELQLTADLVAGISKKIPIVIQPVTRDDKVAVSTVRLLQMQALMAEIHPGIRVIPQTHKFLGVL